MRIERGQSPANAVPLLGGGAHVFRSGDFGAEPEQAFVPVPSGSLAKLVQTFSNGGPVEPAFGLIALRAGTSPELQEDLDGKLFGTRGILYYPGDDARDALVL